MRLLVVEDQPDLRRLIAEILTDDGYVVDISADGIDGLSKAQTYPYDAIVLDLMLPQLDGWELLSRLRRTHRTPVLILSARDTVPDRVQGLDLGADDFLVKPFDRTELLARLRSLIRRSAGQTDNTLMIGDLRVDLKARNAVFGNKALALTAREYALLEYLALHRGRLVSRQELYDHLFDEADEALSNNLDVHMSNLRRKLGQDVIETRRGQGYVIPA